MDGDFEERAFKDHSTKEEDLVSYCNLSKFEDKKISVFNKVVKVWYAKLLKPI
jgi:hypothetical protein